MGDHVATLGGMNLVDDSRAPYSGAAFELSKAARSHGAVAVDGWHIEVRQGLKLVVARGVQQYPSYEGALSAGLLHAQKGLDLLSMKGVDDLHISRFDDLHVAWWPEAGSLIVRIVSISPFGVTVGSPTITVTDASGNVVPSPPQPPVVWHESFRYFRLSQTTDDLFDAYRNAYLALESVLSRIAPQKMNPATGKPREGEGVWFRRALKVAATRVALSSVVPTGTADPLQYLYDELYVGMRSAMSHAKSGRPVLLPRDEAERQRITASLQRLVGLYLKLADASLGARRPGGGMFAIAFRMMTSRTFDGMRAFVSDDESPPKPEDTVLNPAGGLLVELPAVEPTQAVSFLVTRLFAVEAASLQELPFIRRAVTAASDDTPITAVVLEGRLILAGTERLETLFGLRGWNVNQPRERYSF